MKIDGRDFEFTPDEPAPKQVRTRIVPTNGHVAGTIHTCNPFSIPEDAWSYEVKARLGDQTYIGIGHTRREAVDAINDALPDGVTLIDHDAGQ